jgi:5-methylcytosine-specific restriction protein A
MPSRPPTLKPNGAARTPDSRVAPSRRGYGRSWQRVRRMKLALEPWCADHLDRGEHVAATEVDHVKALAAGGTNDPENLRPLCHACHSAKTVRVDGGLGRPKG